MVQVIAFTRPLAHTGKNRHSRVHFGDVIDQFHDQNGFANASTAKQTNFPTFCIGGQKVNHFDPSDQNFGFCRLLIKIRCIAMNTARFG